MHRAVTCVILLAALLGPATGLAARASDDAELRALSVDWMQAIADKDRPALERMLAPEFKLRGAGDPPADAVSRAEWIDNAIGKDWSAFEYENVDIHVDGDRATMSSLLRFRIKPIPFELDSGVVDTWVRRNGQWQVSGRYLGESQFRGRVEFVKGVLATLALVAAFVFVRRWRRRAR